MALKILDGGSIYADVLEGPGPLVVGLHGWGRDRRDLANALQGRARALLDLPGFGSSPPPPEAWGSGEYAACVARALSELNLEAPPIILGHSFGGRVAVCLAAAQPGQVGGLVLTGVPLLRQGTGRKPTIEYRAARRLNRLGIVSDARMNKLREKYGSADYRAASGIMRDVLVRLVNESYEEILPEIGCPVGLVWGSEDTAAPPAVAVAALELLQNCVSLEVLNGVGHDVHRQAPAELDKMVELVALAMPA